ncbi:MAG: DUF1080 domain-containing protein [Mariniphaga sp.]
MRYLLLYLVLLLLLTVSCRLASKKGNIASPAAKELLDSADCCDKGPVNQLTDAEKAQGWELLFNGTDSTGWRGYNKGNFPVAWCIENGTLRCKNQESRGEAGKADGGDIVYSKKIYSNFDLRLEWKISEAGNSGIFYLGREVPGWPIYKSALEMQILDNEKNDDASRGKDGNRKAGSLYDLIPANPQNTKPAGNWNSVEIIVLEGKVAHRQNGKTVLEYELWTPAWKALVENSKFPGMNPEWENIAKEGVIGLQDHGNDVWFRNIKIREL